MASTFKDWVIYNAHTCKSVPFIGTLEDCILRTKEKCKAVGDQFAIFDSSDRERMAATVRLEGWKGGAWFSVFVQPYYRDRS